MAKRLTAEEIKWIAVNVNSGARENAAVTVLEEHGRKDLIDGYVDSHPMWKNYYHSTLDMILSDMQSERSNNYSEYGSPRPITETEARKIRSLILNHSVPL